MGEEMKEVRSTRLKVRGDRVNNASGQAVGSDQRQYLKEKEVTIGYEEVLYQQINYTNGDGVAIETCLYSQLNKQVNSLYTVDQARGVISQNPKLNTLVSDLFTTTLVADKLGPKQKI